ncbi:hypothetical protein K2173_015735 [Erythroxylum novogranatense]|uniref:non-specific serine/threonine protein kinase n=1 Tax=Erythroxylum novogranatense TaxID=1862640 RepID=A0AAV8SEY2_9ROSI|nr:hypothetical protein K2173_015735 [Erythroxylum novogranatense]
MAVSELLPFLVCCFLSLKYSILAQDEAQFIYNGFNGANLLLNGIAKIHPNGLLELTDSSKQQIGRAFFPSPQNFSKTLANNNSDSLSFFTTFVFAILPELPTLGGHGIAFAMSPSTEFKGSVASQYLGLFNTSTSGSSSNHVFAVELDTLLSPEFGDINSNHVGIDINGLRSNVSAPVTYFSDKESINRTLELISGKPMQVWIEYNATEKQLNVTIAPITSEKPLHPLLSTFLDLSTIFWDSMFVGFSSATGEVVSRQYILGWSFNRSGKAVALDKSQLPSLPRNRKSNFPTILRILIPSAALMLLVIFIIVYMIRRKKYEEVREDWEREYGPQRFSYKDLFRATKGFKDKEFLGAGGFGRVYRGTLPSSNVQVAVKKVSHDSTRGIKEFVSEIVSMGRLRHRNLVQLLGYCRRKGELLLVYEYMPNGSLDKFLFSSETTNLSWSQRYQILKGVASALLYLHDEWEQVVLHRDIKASNILLDADLNGRLGDFGLAKFHDHGATPQTTCVAGTVGYLAPELTRTGRPTTCSDVFAFGTFLLEIACGRKPIESSRSADEELILVDWVLDHWKRGLILLTSDPRLEGNFEIEEMKMVLTLGLLCCHPVPATRPNMRQVVRYIDGDAKLPEIPLFNSADLGSGFYHLGREVSHQNNLSAPAIDNYSLNFLSSSNSILSRGR